MEETKKHKGADHPVASIDGIVSSKYNKLGQLHAPTSYRPNRSKPTPSLDNYIRSVDGFRTVKAQPHPLGDAPEIEEAEALLDDEPILLDHNDKAGHLGAKESRRKQMLKRAGMGIVSLAVLVLGFLAWKFIHNTSKVFHGNVLGLFSNTRLRGEDKGRVTILLAGNSADDPGHDGANLTDSIMLLSIDTIHNTGYMLSVPRDLWVSYGTDSCSLGNAGKINAIYECGQEIKFKQNGFPNGGMGLLEKNLDQDFGVDIDYYALIDYSGLKASVNAVGGIDFDVKSDDPRGLYDPSIDWSTKEPLVKLFNGWHHLNGEQALDLARARGDAYGAYGFPQADFDRVQNQRQMLLALKTKVLSASVLTNPFKLSSLFDALGNNVHTDFHVNEIHRLYQLTKKISNNNIQSVGMGDSNVNLVKSANINGVSALLPAAGQDDYSDIKAYIRRLNSNDPVVKEGATAVVLNGSNIDGLATRTGKTLSDKGLDVQSVANDNLHPHTVVVMLNSHKPATQSYLQQKFKVAPTTDTKANPEAKNYSVDFVIILGEDATTTGQN